MECQTLVLSYAYHCCEFLPLMEGGEEGGEVEGPQGTGFSDFVLVPPQHVDPAAWANATDIWSHYRQLVNGHLPVLASPRNPTHSALVLQ